MRMPNWEGTNTLCWKHVRNRNPVVLMVDDLQLKTGLDVKIPCYSDRTGATNVPRSQDVPQTPVEHKPISTLCTKCWKGKPRNNMFLACVNCVLNERSERKPCDLQKSAWNNVGQNPQRQKPSLLVASLLLAAMPFVTSIFLLLVARPGAPSSVIAPSSVLLLSW